MIRVSILAICAAFACSACAQNSAEEAAAPAHRLLIAGDSTAADYPVERAPQIGWGQVIDYYLSDDVVVLNRAVNGRSTKSYIDEGRWDSLMEELQPGDFVIISFGHNDSRDDAPERYGAPDGAYRDNMAAFAEAVEAAGGTAILMSPPARRLWEGPAMVETHGLYRLNAGIAAEQAGVEFIDLSQLSIDYFESIGQEQTKTDFLWLSPETANERFPDGVEDNTHFTEIGACGVARLIAERLPEDLVETANFDEADADEDGRPDDVPACAALAWD
ncbi:rhamnogalacturonan acetylesterase [Ponticaulis sp.]|uniref:rhamnogalacturonan acetylesterase n=1 Tax=Ponticaulis sp. TaxID=2020902 RepID=UPI0025F76CD2|nr:rhamnogalacturonan acetylesterase [Ponticaulis sp.]